MWTALCEQLTTSIDQFQPFRSHGLSSSYVSKWEGVRNVYNLHTAPLEVPATAEIAVDTPPGPETTEDPEYVALQSLTRGELERMCLRALDVLRQRGDLREALGTQWGPRYFAAVENSHRDRCRSMSRAAPPKIQLCRCRRDGVDTMVSAGDLLPGDIVLVRAGDVIQADCTILSVSKAQTFLVNSPHIVGIGASIKRVAAIDATCTDLGDSNSLPAGCVVICGEAVAVVHAVGPATTMGALCASLSSVVAMPMPYHVRPLPSIPGAFSGDAADLVLLQRSCCHALAALDVLVLDRESVVANPGTHRVVTAACGGEPYTCDENLLSSDSLIVPSTGPLLITAFQLSDESTRVVARTKADTIGRFAVATVLTTSRDHSSDPVRAAVRHYIEGLPIFEATTASYTAATPAQYIPSLRLYVSLHTHTSDVMGTSLLVVSGPPRDVWKASELATSAKGVVQTTGRSLEEAGFGVPEGHDGVGVAVMEYSSKRAVPTHDIDLTAFLRQSADVCYVGTWCVRASTGRIDGAVGRLRGLGVRCVIVSAGGRDTLNMEPGQPVVDLSLWRGGDLPDDCEGVFYAREPAAKELLVRALSKGNAAVVGYVGSNAFSAAAMKASHVAIASTHHCDPWDAFSFGGTSLSDVLIDVSQAVLRRPSLDCIAEAITALRAPKT